MFPEQKKSSTDSSLALSPDDEPQTEMRLRGGSAAQPAEPYGMAAFLYGLAVMLLLFGIARHAANGTLLAVTIAGMAFAYVALILIRPQLPHLVLAICAAELAMLSSLPYDALYHNPWHHNGKAFLALLVSIAFTGILGLLLGIGLDIRKQPTMVIAITFLLVFVMSNVKCFFHG